MNVVKCEYAEGGECVTGKTNCVPFYHGYACPRAKEGLLSIFNPADCIAIIWSIDDIIQERPHLEREQAMEVLEALSDNHDANYGVNWETLCDTADLLYPKEEKCI